MTKTRSTKRALLMSGLALLMCVSMLIGSTFAWFTDSVTSAGNKIQSGTLKLDLELYDTENKTWNSIKESKAPIFDYDLWEPGYTEVQLLKVENEGTLALKWMAKFVSTYQLSDLANVIDVYVKPSASELAYPTDRNLDGYTHAGTVAEFVNTIETTTTGNLEAGDVAYLGIALKMQESADNKYQGMDLGGTFDIQIFATQYTSESDSFNNQYDAMAKFDDDAPVAKVTILNANSVIKNPENITVLDEGLTIVTNGSRFGMDLGTLQLDTAYQFEPTLSAEEVKESELKTWHADFVVSANKDVPAYSLALAGYYDAWCEINDYKWVALTTPDPILANQEIRLIDVMGGGALTVSYKDLSDYGNDGIGFVCGAVALDNEMLEDFGATTQGLEEGTVLTVELRLYEATDGSRESEKGPNDYISVGKYTYTF